MKQFNTLLTEYKQLRDDLLDHTEEFHDSMAYDIEGYDSLMDDEQEVYLDELNNQVKQFRKIYDALKEVKYVFG